MPDHRLAVIKDQSNAKAQCSSSDIARELSDRLQGEVRFSTHDRLLYATDASLYQAMPIGVVVPASIDDAGEAIRYAAEKKLPLLPRGGGTSLAGQAVNAALVIDFSTNCHAILNIDAARREAQVEPGVVLDHFNRALAPHGLMFGPDVATSTHANLGGMIGNNSAGAHSILYGRTVEHVLGLDVMLADGTRLTLEEGASERDERIATLTTQVVEVVMSLETMIDQRFPKTLRRVNGYNLDLMLEQIRRSTP
ncbi:MAG: FAD-binding oxidoreductase, partial [Planctomycetota bacterium]|nr:FAD-binding oxidoreductase [Planctomycetota bacterium]